MVLTKLYKGASKYFDVVFFTKFILLYCVLYYFTYVYMALSDPRGSLYFPFLGNHYINYVSAFEKVIIYTSNKLSHSFGLPSYVVFTNGLSKFENPPIIAIKDGASVVLSNGCLGLGIMSFWISFIVCQPGSVQRKIAWGIAGLLVIFFINCFRISFLLYALQNKWQRPISALDHHTLFNITAYIVVFMFISLYTSGNLKKHFPVSASP